MYSIAVVFGFFFGQFCFCTGWVVVYWKLSYILLDSNLNKRLCGLKLASLKWGIVGIGSIQCLMWHLGYEVIWLYSQRMRHQCWSAKLYCPCLNTLWFFGVFLVRFWFSFLVSFVVIVTAKLHTTLYIGDHCAVLQCSCNNIFQISESWTHI